MAAWTVAARQVSNLARLSTPKSASSTTQVSSLIQRRSFAAGGGNLRFVQFFFLLNFFALHSKFQLYRKIPVIFNIYQVFFKLFTI